MTTDQRPRFHFLVKACIISSSGEVRFNDRNVSQFYLEQLPKKTDNDRKKQFTHDAKSLVKQLQAISDVILDPFFLPLPKMGFDKTRGCLHLLSGRRPVVVQKHKEIESLDERQRLVHFTLQSEWPGRKGKMIVPPTGKLYAGFGTTTCFLFRTLLENLRDNHNLVVYTASEEICAMMYYLHEKQEGKLTIRLTQQLEIDRKFGIFVPHTESQEVNVAIISYHRLIDGQFYSTAPSDYRKSVLHFLEKAQRRVIIMDKWKIGGDVGRANPVDVPKLDDEETLIVSNLSQVEAQEHLPKGRYSYLAMPTDWQAV